MRLDPCTSNIIVCTKINELGMPSDVEIWVCSWASPRVIIDDTVVGAGFSEFVSPEIRIELSSLCQSEAFRQMGAVQFQRT